MAWTPEIISELASVRRRRGLSAAALARMAGVSRQTIYAMEAGTYVPNTAVGLRLARALDVKVEDLFALADGRNEDDPALATVSLVPASENLEPSQAVRLCEVNGKLLAVAAARASCFLPASDGTITGRTSVTGKAKVQLHGSMPDPGSRLLVAGCDPAMSTLARHLQPSGIELVLLHQNSRQALSLLKSGQVHVAGTHLRDYARAEPNLAAIGRALQSEAVAVISFAIWEEGLVVGSGNPKQFGGVTDLARTDVVFINREAGAGCRALLDRQLKLLNLDPSSVDGYQKTAPGHLAAAWEVKSGRADCCIATGAAARTFGLDFIPLESARYDLVIRKQHMQLAAIQTLFDVMNQSKFRMKLKGVGGYDTSVTGSQIL